MVIWAVHVRCSLKCLREEHQGKDMRVLPEKWCQHRSQVLGPLFLFHLGLRNSMEVWSLVRRFDEPGKYKPFVKQCLVMGGLVVGSVRDITLTSELPATFTTEVLERLDDSERILGIRTVGGDHILKNHSSIVTVHPDRIEGRTGTTVVESFVVDLPENNTRDEICYFMEAVIKINLRSLAAVSERLAQQ
ncbi:hypothetical protein LUZ63_016577 [Rhynchospora breviuscula]|uniref:Uncharacterized protein n=1 Tax=Rhynchospora breviuscula TaxID=2022672 RepID=A0A9Q0C1B7_9POAL|nr:hypothetical protein LUZ63_016577 [Rhynchospora breviuscula]